jgi:hypothetical protein
VAEAGHLPRGGPADDAAPPIVADHPQFERDGLGRPCPTRRGDPGQDRERRVTPWARPAARCPRASSTDTHPSRPDPACRVAGLDPFPPSRREASIPARRPAADRQRAACHCAFRATALGRGDPRSGALPT